MGGKKQDYVRKKFKPMLDKSMSNALAHRIGKEFPRIGGRRIRNLCAEMILEVVQEHLAPAEHIHHGQIRWLAVSIDDPPSRGKTIADTDLVPVLLDLHHSEDIHARLRRSVPSELLEQKAIRLSQQAFNQGGLLSNSDLAELLTNSEARISGVLSAYEKRTGTIVPRRANIHDVGTGVTHKLIICRKKFIDGLPSEIIARETIHSIEAVDRYLGQYSRVLYCRNLGMSSKETASVLNCSENLVNQYLTIVDEIDKNGGPKK